MNQHQPSYKGRYVSPRLRVFGVIGLLTLELRHTVYSEKGRWRQLTTTIFRLEFSRWVYPFWKGVGWQFYFL